MQLAQALLDGKQAGRRKRLIACYSPILLKCSPMHLVVGATKRYPFRLKITVYRHDLLNQPVGTIYFDYLPNLTLATTHHMPLTEWSPDFHTWLHTRLSLVVPSPRHLADIPEFIKYL